MDSDNELNFDDTELELEQIEEGDQAEGDGEANEDENTSANPEPVKIKRVRNPQPKLDAQTLKGKRGLYALPTYFERVKYKGKGHEEEDLNVALKTYEYWCHRLFPKFPFDDCVSKIEKLGSKKAVQTHIKLIRMDMYRDDDIPMPDDSSDADSVHGDGNKQFDDLLDEPLASQTVQLTEEQIEMIRINRERAEKLRQEKLKKARESSQSIINTQESLSTQRKNSESEEDDIEDVFSKIRELKQNTMDREDNESESGVFVDNLRHTEISQSQNNFGSNLEISSQKSLDNQVEVSKTPEECSQNEKSINVK